MTRTIAPAKGLDEILEKEWQRQVVDLAKQVGWTRIYHTFDSRRSTHGFPDLVIVRERIVYLELKREKGRLTDDQVSWLIALRDAGGEVYVARPRHLEALGRVLARRGRIPSELDAIAAAELAP